MRMNFMGREGDDFNDDQQIMLARLQEFVNIDIQLFMAVLEMTPSKVVAHRRRSWRDYAILTSQTSKLI